MKFLIDECVSQKLAKIALARGHEASHVVWLKKSGWKDWSLKTVILEGDWTFVTKNSADFRGLEAAPGATGQYAGVEIHAGLICLNGPVGMHLDLQLELFEVALDELAGTPGLVNQVLEICASEDEEIAVLRYALPPSS